MTLMEALKGRWPEEPSQEAIDIVDALQEELLRQWLMLSPSQREEKRMAERGKLAFNIH